LFNNTFPFTVSLPLPLPVPCSLPFPGPCLTALRVLSTLAIVIVIAIARTAPSTAQCSGIRPVLIIIILIDYLIPIQWSNGQEVTWLVLLATWWLNLCPEIIATVPREILAGVLNLSQAGCLKIGAIDLIPEGTGVVPPPIVHLIAGFVKHLPHIWGERCPPLPKRWTPAPAVRPHQLELWKVASRDWIKKDYIIKEVPGPLILDATNIVYPYESMDVFQDESLYTVPIQRRASIYNWCRHFCPSSYLSLFFAAALWCHRCQLKMNRHPRRYHYDTVDHSGRKPRVNIQSWVGYRVCVGTRGVVLCKSCDVEIVQDAGGVFNCWRCV